tara:strand:- start:304 stop:1305 length:1002 start_codon:yes stop_codon:yes gene_type:complete
MYIIAEIGVNHDGKLDKAIKLIDEAKKLGCNAVKFQSFYADKLVHPSARKVDYQLRSGEDSESHHEMIKKLEFNGEKFIKCFQYAKSLGIDFITTPYDPESAHEAYENGVRIFKVASADLSDPYINRQLSKYKDIKVYLSTGMSDINLIKKSLSFYTYCKPTILHCVSNYPCEDNSLNMRCFDLLKKNFSEYELGFSDHSLGFTAAIVAATLGFNVFERHFTLNKNDEGPDHYASSDVKEMEKYISEINRVKNILGTQTKEQQKEESGMSLCSKKAIISKIKILKGELITYENTYALRPAEQGISVDNISSIIGLSANLDIEKNKFIQYSDLQ